MWGLRSAQIWEEGAEAQGRPQNHIVKCVFSASLRTSNCTHQKSFKVTNVEGNGCIRISTGRTHWTNFIPTSPKLFFKIVPVLFVEKHEKFLWGFLRNQGRRRNNGQLENLFFLCGSLISLSLAIIKLSVAPTVLVTNGKMKKDFPPLQGLYSKMIRPGRIVVLLAQLW